MLGTVITAVILVGVVIWAVHVMLKDKKSGKSSCGGDCGHCGGCH